MDTAPHDALHLVYRFLLPKEVCNAAVCHHVLGATRADAVWRTQFRHQFGRQAPANPLAAPAGMAADFAAAATGAAATAADGKHGHEGSPSAAETKPKPKPKRVAKVPARFRSRVSAEFLAAAQAAEGTGVDTSAAGGGGDAATKYSDGAAAPAAEAKSGSGGGGGVSSGASPAAARAASKDADAPPGLAEDADDAGAEAAADTSADADAEEKKAVPAGLESPGLPRAGATDGKDDDEMDGMDDAAKADTFVWRTFRDLIQTSMAWRHAQCSVTRVNAHVAGVPSIAVSKDQTTVVTCSYDGSAVVWSPAETPGSGDAPKAVATLTGHINEVTAGAVTGNGRVVTASKDGVVKLWDVSDPTDVVCDATASAPGAVRCLDAKGNTVAAGGLRHMTVFKTSARGGSVGGFTDTAQFRGSASTVALSDDGQRLLWSGRSPVLRLWGLGDGDTVERSNLCILRGHPGIIKATQWDGGSAAVSGDDTGRVMVWDLHASVATAELNLFTDDYPLSLGAVDFDRPRGGESAGAADAAAAAAASADGDGDDAIHPSPLMRDGYAEEAGEARWAAKTYSVDMCTTRGVPLVAAAGNFPAINVFDTRTPVKRPSILIPFPAPTGTVFFVKLLPEYDLVLSGTNDGAVRAHDMRVVTSKWGHTVQPLWTLRDGEALPGAGGCTSGEMWFRRTKAAAPGAADAAGSGSDAAAGAGAGDGDTAAAPASATSDVGAAASARLTKLWEPAPSVWCMEVMNRSQLWVGHVSRTVNVYDFGVDRAGPIV